MLWLKLFYGFSIFKPVWFLFSFVSDYVSFVSDHGYESETKESVTGLKVIILPFLAMISQPVTCVISTANNIISWIIINNMQLI